MLNVYTEILTTRVEYAFRLIFTTILNEKVEFFTDTDTFKKLSGAKINYSKNNELNGLQIVPVSLLFENEIVKQEIEWGSWDDLPAFFPTKGTLIPYDIFAASFYLATRYEEYLPSATDAHGRYNPDESCLVKKGLIKKPLINYWANHLADIVEKDNIGFKFKRSKFTYLPTIDVDNAYAYLNKGLWRNLLSSLNDLFHFKVGQLLQRLKVLMNIEQDPFDNYDFLYDLFNKYSFESIFFFLLNDKGKYDRALSPSNKEFRKLINNLAAKYEMGIHPSYLSNFDNKQLKKEITVLNEITGHKTSKSRQHFLKLELPKTYHNLLQNRILTDYTMGYAQYAGFRASIATPFPFFDLFENNVTTLTVCPFQVMDVTLRQYMKLSPMEALSEIELVMNETANVGGLFVSLWHNESLSNKGIWADWKSVYEKMTHLAHQLAHEE